MRSLELARRTDTRVGVLALDLDGLKPINDVHGHAAGDEALKIFADRLRGVVRSSDTVARLGGDEFGVVLTELEGLVDAADAMKRYAVALETATFDYDGHALPVGASFGMAMFPDDSGDLAALLEAADKAMYDLKRSRKTSA